MGRKVLSEIGCFASTQKAIHLSAHLVTLVALTVNLLINPFLSILLINPRDVSYQVCL